MAGLHLDKLNAFVYAEHQGWVLLEHAEPNRNVTSSHTGRTDVWVQGMDERNIGKAKVYCPPIAKDATGSR